MPRIAAVLARAKAASGGDLADAARSWRGDGTFAAGSLSGEFHADHRPRERSLGGCHTLGSVGGADGYDGVRAWGQDRRRKTAPYARGPVAAAVSLARRARLVSATRRRRSAGTR
jgi:hypothetical protein